MFLGRCFIKSTTFYLITFFTFLSVALSWLRSVMKTQQGRVDGNLQNSMFKFENTFNFGLILLLAQFENLIPVGASLHSNSKYSGYWWFGARPFKKVQLYQRPRVNGLILRWNLEEKSFMENYKAISYQHSVCG